MRTTKIICYLRDKITEDLSSNVFCSILFSFFFDSTLKKGEWSNNFCRWMHLSKLECIIRKYFVQFYNVAWCHYHSQIPRTWSYRKGIWFSILYNWKTLEKSISFLVQWLYQYLCICPSWKSIQSHIHGTILFQKFQYPELLSEYSSWESNWRPCYNRYKINVMPVFWWCYGIQILGNNYLKENSFYFCRTLIFRLVVAFS